MVKIDHKVDQEKQSRGDEKVSRERGVNVWQEVCRTRGTEKKYRYQLETTNSCLIVIWVDRLKNWVTLNRNCTIIIKYKTSEVKIKLI